MRFYLLLILLLLIYSGSDAQPGALQDKVIVIDPGHGGTAGMDNYRVGPAGEREEWINLRVATYLNKYLRKAGARPIMTRHEDEKVDLKERADLAKQHQADLFISIHHNATADPEVNFPIVYFHGYASENQASVALGRQVASELRLALFDYSTPVSLVSDHTIFPIAGTAVLRYSYGIPAIISEASFFTNPREERRLKRKSYNRKEAKALFRAIENYFSLPQSPILPYQSEVELEPFIVYQEEERMQPEARDWNRNFLKGLELVTSANQADLQQAYQLFEMSARTFPDSYVAAQCHIGRAEAREKLGDQEQAEKIRTRVDEFYINVP